MSVIEELKFLRLILLSYDTSLNVIRGFTETKVLSKHNGKLSEFLEGNIHEIFHLWKNYTLCCKCGETIKKKQSKVLKDPQIETIFDFNGTQNPAHNKWNDSSKQMTYCLCKVSVKQGIKLKDIDVTLIYTLLKNFAILDEDELLWLKAIKGIRDKLAHATSTNDFEEGKLDRWWTKLEGSILGIASKFPISSYESLIKDNIDELKTKEFTSDKAKSVLKKVEEQTGKVVESLFDQTALLMKHTEKHKEEIIQFQTEVKDSIQESVTDSEGRIRSQMVELDKKIASRQASFFHGIEKLLQQLSEEQQIEVKNFQRLVLEGPKEQKLESAIVKGNERFFLKVGNTIVMVECFKQQKTAGDDQGEIEGEKLDFAGALEGASINSNSMSGQGAKTVDRTSIDDTCTSAEVCKVEWKVVTPGNWDVERIADKLNQVAALLKEIINIDFVRTGSLVMYTTVPCHIMKDRDQFHIAVDSLFAKIVEVCTLDVEKPNVIKAFLSVEYPTVPITTKTLVIHTTVPVKVFKDRHLLQAASESFLTRIFQKCEIDTEQYSLVKVDMNVKDIPRSSHKLAKITEPKERETKEISLKSAQIALTTEPKESKEKHLFASEDNVPWKFRFGFKRLISLKEKEPNDLVMTFDRYKWAFDKALNEKDMRKNKETISILLRCLSKCCECKSLSEQTKEIFSILERSSFLKDHVVQFVENMVNPITISQSVKDQYKVSLRDLFTVLLKLRSLVPKSRIVVTGIHSVIETPINILRSDTEIIDDETWEMFRQLEQGRYKGINQDCIQERHITDAGDTGVVNFREFSTFPTTEEVQAASPPLLRPNKSFGGYTNLDHYLDVQYKLLREDFVAPLRESIRDYIEATNSPTPLKRKYDFTMYYDVQIISPICNYHGLCRRLSFTCRNMNKIRWESSKHLIYGSLLCLSSDDFQTVWFATVTDRELDNIRRGLVDVKFEKDYEEVSSISPDTVFVMAETTAYFEAYKHVMVGMQRLHSGDLPFERHIVQCIQVVNEPLYIKRNAVAKYDLRPLVDNDVRLSDQSSSEYGQNQFSKSSSMAENVQIMKAESWPPAELLHLDESQLHAVRNALTKEFALIQGPPGTGKTYIGVKIVKTLLHNSHIWSKNFKTGVEEKRPILVICYTNHALDQFLEEIVKCYSGEVLRLGGRSSNNAMKPLSIINKRMTMRLERNVPLEIHSSKMEIKHNLCFIMEEVNNISLRVERAKRDILHEDTLKEIMGSFYKNLKSRCEEILHEMYGRKKNRRRRKNFCAMLEWLGFGELLGFESTDEPDPHEKTGNQNPDSIGNDDISLTHQSYYGDFISVLDENDADIAERCNATDEIFEDYDEDEKTSKDRLKDDISQRSSFPVALDVSNIEAFQMETIGDRFLFQKPEQKAGKWKKKIRKKLISSDRMTASEVETLSDVWELLPDHRWRLYRHWLYQLCNQLEDSIREKEVEFDRTCRKYHEILMQEDKAIMKNSSIIGLTTTCAARYQTVLQEIGPKIVIVEEAAEVLEGHIISSLSRDCEHLVLIGDHRQLKPKPTVYKLAKDYNLDLSLFERMANNGVELQCLAVQHRMSPKISDMMRIIYPNLEDHDIVKRHDSVRGIAESVYFIDHSEPESYEKDLRSRSNQYEADYLVRLCRYILAQGYCRSQITVLTTYSGQLFELKYRMPKSEFDGVRVTVVDNYQGEENDIVLLSLVRSNEDRNIGFLQEDNRTCVALSRARIGLFVIGNFTMLADKSELWQKIVDHAVKNNIFGKQLLLVCPNHHDSRSSVDHPSDFDRLANVQCNRKCEFVLSCGHTCPKPCHQNDTQHKDVVCDQSCIRRCPMGHVCGRKCYNECGKCMVKTEKIHLECGHRQILPCYLDPKDAKCEALCEKYLACGHKCQYICGESHSKQCNKLLESVGSCGHIVKYPCHMKKENKKDSLCSEPCSAALECGHVCQGTCGACYQGRIHLRCNNPCKKTLLCQHECLEDCKSCTSCRKKCQNECKHKTCDHICAEDCMPCTDICTWKCQHYECTEICSSPCDRQRCDKPCLKKMPECNHECCGLCGEPCPQVCAKCFPLSKLIVSNSRQNRAVRYVQLEDCPHIVEVDLMDRLMDDAQGGKIALKSCPSCKTPIRRTRRYGRAIKETLHHIEIIKQRIIGNKSSVDSHENTIRHNLFNMTKDDAEEIEHNFITLTSELKDEETLRTISEQIELIKTLQALKDDMKKCSSTSAHYSKVNEKVHEELGILRTFVRKQRRYFTLQEIVDIETETRRLMLFCDVKNFRETAEVLSQQNPFPRELELMLDTTEGYLTDGKRLSEQRSKDIMKSLDAIKKFCPDVSRSASNDYDFPRLSHCRNLLSADWFLCDAGHIYSEYDVKSGGCPECKEEFKNFL